MVRISDILKRAKERKEEEKPSPVPTQPPPPKMPPPPKQVPTVPEETGLKRVEEQVKPKIPGIRISPVVTKEAKAASDQECIKLYEDAVSLMRELLKKRENISDYKLVDIKKIASQVEKIVDQLVLGNEKLLMLTFNGYPTPQDYYPYHSVNVCIYSISVCLGLRYEKPSLMDMGISSLIHDIGMTGYLELASQPRKLTPKEYTEIKNHPEVTNQILGNIIGLNKLLIQVASQEHERIDGSGYPKGLKQESIDEYARIIGIVDVYEAMTHPRPYRKEYLPSEAIGEIMAHKEKFDQKIIKILVERIGIFPLGSLVELNTKEIAQVIKPNYNYPMRPIVKVIRDAGGNILKEPKIIDLITKAGLCIKRCISCKKGS